MDSKEVTTEERDAMRLQVATDARDLLTNKNVKAVSHSHIILLHEDGDNIDIPDAKLEGTRVIYKNFVEAVLRIKDSSTEYCQVCARGALLVAKMIQNKLDFQDIGTGLAMDGDWESPADFLLYDTFSKAELCVIEILFEAECFGYHRRILGESVAYDLQGVALNLREDTNMPDYEILYAILSFVIKNYNVTITPKLVQAEFINFIRTI